MAAVAIEGASPEQDALLRKLLGELTLQPHRLAIEPWDPVGWDELASLGVERGDRAYAEPTGVALYLLEPTELSIREEWELELLGSAFRDASARLGLPEVQCVGHANASASIRSVERLEEPAPTPDSAEEQVRRAALLTTAHVEELDLLQPDGLACAVVLAVAEPHGHTRRATASGACVTTLGAATRSTAAGRSSTPARRPARSWNARREARRS